MVVTTEDFTAAEQTMGNSNKKLLDTATRASLGQGVNQSIVQPEVNPGNFRDLERNFGPTYWEEQRKRRWN